MKSKLRLAAWALVFPVVSLIGLLLGGVSPPQPSTIELQVVFPSFTAAKSEPLFVTGLSGAGDFLFVQYIDAQTVLIGYDSWGRGGPMSKALSVPLQGTKRHLLRVKMPSLGWWAGMSAQWGDLRVSLDGEEVLTAFVPAYPRKSDELYVGQNPLGGTRAGPRFNGEILEADGRSRASSSTGSDWRGALRGWLRFGYPQLVVLACLGFLFGAFGRRALCRARLHLAFSICTVICTVTFASILTAGESTFIHSDVFGQFYDFQARSLLEGRLDVPDAGISEEAFVYQGKRYGYFGPTPALLRLPLVTLGVGFGKVTRLAMFVAYIGCLFAAYLILCDVWRPLNATSPRPPAWLVAFFMLNVGLGSTLFYLSSRAYVYHEAILWGVMFALWSAWCAVRHLATPSARWWVGSLGFGVLSVHARPPTGLYALTLLGCVAAVAAWRERKNAGVRAKHLIIGAAAIVGVASFNGLSYLKFRTFNGSPLHLHVQYNPGRLARIEGKEFHRSNMPLNAYMYFAEPNLQIGRNFPWLLMTPSKSPGEFRNAKMDYPDLTLALPYSNTGLFMLGLLGIAGAGMFSFFRSGFIPLGWIAALPVTLAMVAAVAITHRYTADFSPFLICAAAGGAACLPTFGRRTRNIAAPVLMLATVWSIVLTSAITLRYQGELVWGVPTAAKERYQQLQRRIDGWFKPIN